ncbi:hypothetical protein PoB_001676000 [Plakobranchus ocellatus]|uniref:Uncharacterized protein n=1 Tax=Plakobranchus ocellatus TaxID=259542 RepID=A0AAV3Z526_9GAST|nr:hypothetical protein PoB_001676000 [Plakobranchus ocellatus]
MPNPDSKPRIKKSNNPSGRWDSRLTASSPRGTSFQAPVGPGRQWRGASPQQKGPCRSHGELASHCANDAPDKYKRAEDLVGLNGIGAPQAKCYLSSWFIRLIFAINPQSKVTLVKVEFTWFCFRFKYALNLFKAEVLTHVYFVLAASFAVLKTHDDEIIYRECGSDCEACQSLMAWAVRRQITDNGLKLGDPLSGEVWVLYKTNPQQGDFRLSDPPPTVSRTT